MYLIAMQYQRSCINYFSNKTDNGPIGCNDALTLYAV
jgi:hypothetical protein